MEIVIGENMENRTIMSILLLIIIVLTIAIGIIFLHPFDSKEPTKIRIISNKTLDEGNSMSIKLTDLNKTVLTGEDVNVTVKNGKGKIVLNKTAKTNSKGIAKVKLDLKKGKYAAYATYGGNENYTGSNATQKLKVREVKATLVSSSTQSSSHLYSIDNLPPSNDPYPETNRYQLDENFVVQEYSDHYRSVVDLRTGERSGGFF